MAKKKEVTSLSIDPDLHQDVKSLKDVLGCSKSVLICNAVELYLDAVSQDEDGDKSAACFSLEEEIIDQIKEISQAKNNTPSEVLEKILKKYLPTVANGSDTIPVVLQIPKSLRSDKIELSDWLGQRSNSIVKALVAE